MFSAVLDTCTLVPSLQRDFLLESAINLYRPLWSPKIEEELRRVLSRYRISQGVSEEVADAYTARLLDQMNTSFPDACVEYPSDFKLPKRDELPDINDEHVIVTALTRRADIIVTNNVKDFPLAILSPYNIGVSSPDEFLTNLFDLYPSTMKSVLEIVSGRTGNKGPRLTVKDIVNKLDKSTPMFAGSLREAISA